MQPSTAKLGRPIVSGPHIGVITQGTIFSCATASRYKAKSVFGLTITARCDVAQDKYRLLNYVPVVSLDDWFRIDGSEALVDAECKELHGKIKGELKQAGVSQSLLLSISISDILSAHFPEGDRKKAMARQRIETANRDLCAIKQAHDKGLAWEWLAHNRPAKIRETISRLFKHELSGYYFLERIEPDTRPNGYVCLLREVATLPKDVVEDLREGMTRDRWRARHQSLVGELLDFAQDDFAMPLSQIGSPTIEHLMQVYANLFTRIGIDDPDSSDVEEICGRLGPMQEGSK